ncbi:MAG: signal peptide peptidase SppA [Chloroflexi bacterium]|nr:signal peptide peptidase SppA [Chloroflexota bacterium]
MNKDFQSIMEEPTAVLSPDLPPSGLPQAEQPASGETKKTDRTPLWVLIGVVVGFLLPVCSCAVLAGTAVFGASILGFANAPGTSGAGFGDAVAIVRIEGTILSGDQSSSGGEAVSGRVIRDLENAAGDPSVKAIILLVDSPGGSVTGSAQIWEALQTIEKPIVVSMVGVAASGGYYVSAPADYIIARPDTLTGSLGVIMTLYDASELIDKVGVKVIDITSGENKAMGSTWAELTPGQRAILESITNEAYEEFVRVIADGRHLSEEEVRVLADGRVYSGRQALANGLVDQLGNFQDAITKAAELGGISGEPRVVEYANQAPTLREIILGFTTQLGKTEAERTLDLLTEFTTPSLEYRYVGPGAE